ncbi:PQQ-binding-like beta-propeller repeat protein [Pirellulaceae bacterium SH449]
MFATRVVAFAVSILTAASVCDAQEQWLSFRGPGARGISQDDSLPLEWNSTSNVIWKKEIPGRGWSSPIVVGNRVILATVVNSSVSEEAKKGLYFGGDRSKPSQSSHRWVVVCLNAETGELDWERTVKEGVPEFPIHIKNSYASETPVSDGKRLYVYFGNVGLFCFDLEGNELWSKAFESNPMRAGWGTAASPVVHEDRIYIVNDNEKDSYLLAIDSATGQEVWRRERDEKSNWSTPFVWTNSLRTEIVTAGTNGVRSYDLSGNELWSIKGMSSITIATPYAIDDLLIVSSGYVLDSKRPIYAIRPGGSGDISVTGELSSSEFVVWSLPRSAPYNPSTVVMKDKLFVLYDRGTIAGFGAKDGSKLISDMRIPDGRAFTASPWVVGNKLFCLNEDGVTFVYEIGETGDTLELLGTNPLESDDMALATPAIANGRLYLRTDKRIYCIAFPE